VTTSSVIGALATLSASAGVRVALDGSTLTVADRPIEIPDKLTGERRELFGVAGLLPTVPRADDRDKLLWRVIAEARLTTPTHLLPDRDLERGLTDRLPLTGEASRAVSEALLDRFFNNKVVPVLLPVHSSLPLNYVHTTREGRPAGYRMFSGAILPFLLWRREDGVDLAPLEKLLAVVSDAEHLTVLDLVFLRIALEGAADADAKPDAAALVSAYNDALHDDFATVGGPFCQPSMDLFRRDLETVLDTNLPRPDKVQWLTLLLSLHVAIRLYRIAIVKGGELDLAVAAAAQIPPPTEAMGCPCTGETGCLTACPLAGQLRFRTGTGRYRRISQQDGCRTAYVQMDQRRLLDMPATLVTTTLAGRAWAALGGDENAQHHDMRALAAALDRDPELRRFHGVACAAIAVLHHDAWRKGTASQPELEDVANIGPARPGLYALRDDVRRMRRRDLRHQSRDIVNQLLLDVNVVGPGSLVSRNGTIGFYEMDEQMLLLLVRIVCADNQLPYESFLQGLLAYGLAPQNAQEKTALADALERLGMLVRYSDAGEAAFVHYA
jgi:hypothetical protein